MSLTELREGRGLAHAPKGPERGEGEERRMGEGQWQICIETGTGYINYNEK